jgi:gas vesicle protein
MATRGGNFLAGLLTGALVGASLAMVLAPAGVDEARDVLRAKARDAAERARAAAAAPANEMM